MGQNLRSSSFFAVVRIIVFLCALSALATGSALAQGWGPTDFLVSQGSCGSVLVYDQNFVFKNYLDYGSYQFYPLGIDFNTSGQVVVSNAGQGAFGYHPMTRTYDSSGVASSFLFDPTGGASYDLALHPVSGNIFRGQSGNSSGVREYTPAGAVVRTLNSAQDYYGVAILPGDILWAGRDGAIDVFNLTTGLILSSIDVTVDGQSSPYSIFYSEATNTLLTTNVSSFENPSAVFERAVNGSFVRRFDGPPEFSYYRGVTRGPNGDVYAVGNSQIVRWSADGTFQSSSFVSCNFAFFSDGGILWAGNIGAYITDTTVIETNGGTVDATFMVTAPASTQTRTIDWATADDTAIAPDDYLQASGTLSFAPGETEKSLTVQVNGETVDEANEMFKVLLSNPVNTRIADGEGIATILDDEPTISVGPDVSQNESVPTMTFTISLSAPSTEEVRVYYTTADGTASSEGFLGREYTGSANDLFFAPGETEKTIVIDITADTRYEPDETFFFNLITANTGIADGQAIGTILNDDPIPSLTIIDNDLSMTELHTGIGSHFYDVALSNPSEQTITVDFATANGTATAGGAYQGGTDYIANSGTLTFLPEAMTRQIELQVQSDVRDENDETFFVNLSNLVNAQFVVSQAFGTILDDDSPPAISIGDVTVTEGNTGTRNATFNVSLSAVSGLPITFTYATSNGTATGVLGPQRETPDETGNRDYQTASGSITIPPGSSSAAINVVILGDVVKEPNETFLVNLSQATNSSFADDQATGTITDDDSTPTLSIADVTISEGNSGSSNATFTVTLSGNSDLGITVDYATADGSAAAGSDYTTASGNLSFGPDVLSRTFTVEILGDMAVEAAEGFVVNLSNATNATIGDGQAAGTITNDDTDVPSILSLNPRTGPAAGGQNLTITGTNFRSGASVLFGSSEATGESVSTSSAMAATTPALTAGTLLSVTVTNTDTTTVTRPASYFADFTDVPASNAFHDFIVKLAVNNVTLGCTGGAYCPTQNVNRTAMATFIARSAVGGDANVPISGMVGITPYACGTGGTSAFTDVAAANAFCKYIHYVASRGMMNGCTGTQFCTSPLVVRDEMAGFIARALVPGGEANVPFAYTDTNTGRSYDLNAGIVNFTDMADNAYTRHAHYIWARGVIDGCGDGTTYCPTGTVNRAAMAKFLTNAFGLTWP